MTNPDRLAKAKQRRFDDRLLFIALHLDYVICPMLIGTFAFIVKVAVS